MSDNGTEDLDGLIRDLTDVEDLVPRKARQAVQQTAIRTKKSWAADARRGPEGRRYAPTIDYEVRGSVAGGGTIEAEVGPDLARYGGKTGRGGLVPSFGIFDDPNSDVNGTSPSRARRRAERFAVDELTTGLSIAVDQSLEARNL